MTYQTKIAGTGQFLPDKIVTNDDLSKLMDTSDEWISKRTGIKERRVSDVDKGEFPSHMGAEAAKEAIQKAGLNPNDIDLILFSCTIPDYFFPNTSTVVKEKLGINRVTPCMDINAACTGWLYGFVVADSLIKTGTYKNILLIGCEMTSSFNSWKNRVTDVLFGDGAGAVVLTRSEEDEDSRVIAQILDSDPTEKDALIIEAGAAVKPITKEIIDNGTRWATMDGQRVFKAAVKTMSSHCQTVLEESKTPMSDVDWFIPHQANQRIIEAVGNRFEFPAEKVISTVHKYANTSSASIPIAMNEAIEEGKLKRGQIVLMSAFGAGLTSGALLIKY